MLNLINEDGEFSMKVYDYQHMYHNLSQKAKPGSHLVVIGFHLDNRLLRLDTRSMIGCVAATIDVVQGDPDAFLTVGFSKVPPAQLFSDVALTPRVMLVSRLFTIDFEHVDSFICDGFFRWRRPN
jgi:hypothetical protein